MNDSEKALKKKRIVHAVMLVVLVVLFFLFI